MPHTIRLAGPWERRTTNDHWERITLPVTSRSETDVVLRRRFNGSPGMLQATQVRLRITGASSDLDVWLNDQQVQRLPDTSDSAEDSTLQYDLTPVLSSANMLQIQLNAATDSTVEHVVLAIFETNRRGFR